MALSLKDSLKSIQEANAAASTFSLRAARPIEEVAVASTSPFSDQNFTPSNKYKWYEEYSDSKVSYVDENKNITVDSSQINITQEENSQFIPFQIPRYWDGIDLMNMTIRILYVNKKGEEDIVDVVNVSYSTDTIQFAWLVGYNTTYLAGEITFEIFATGVNEKGENYVWKTRPNGKLNILESLQGNGIVQPSQDWLTSLFNSVDAKLAEAQDLVESAKQASEEALDAAKEANDVVETAKAELEASVDTAVAEKVATALSSYYTKSEVDELLENIDISEELAEVNKRIDSIDGLAAFDVTYDDKTGEMVFYNGTEIIKSFTLMVNPSEEWTSDYTATIDQRISDAVGVVQADLDTTKTDLATTKTDLAEVKSDVSAVETSVGTLSSTVTKNSNSVTALSTKVTELEGIVGSIDTTPGYTYEATYDEEYTYTLWEIQNEGDDGEVRSVKSQFKIVGGGGGGATSSVLKIEYVTKTPLVVTTNDKAEITFNFSGTDSSGDAVLEGMATWKVGGTAVATQNVVAGENTFDITDYLSVGTQKVLLSITDDAGSLVTKTWTVQKIDVRIESNFNDRFTYPIGTVTFDYTPYGAISKDVHFILDGEEIGTVTTSSSGVPTGYDLPAQAHGAHLLEVYMTATVNNNTIESNHIVKDILWYDSTSSIPVIGTTFQNFEARQYDSTNIEYTVYDPTTETPTVEIAVDGNVVSTPTLTEATNIYSFKTDVVGEHKITITCGETVKTLTANITKLDINVTPVTAGLVFDFNPSGKSNNDTDRIWSTDTVAMSVSDNFDWVNGGYQYDANGDQYFCVKAGTSAEINYELFADDAKKNGKEFKLVFKTTNVAKPDATFLHCMDNTTDTDHIGIQMDVHEAFIYGQAGNLQLAYSEEDIIEFEFNISKNTEAIPMVMGYEDGVSTRPMVYDDSYNFTQNSPKVISLGSEDCDLHIYRFKVYNTSLSDRGILNNFIADARNAEEMISRYDRNQIYDENQNLDPDILAAKCPWLRVYKLSAPYFTNNKSDKVPGTTIQQIYKNGDPILDNWTCYNAMHSGQGTSSNNYGAAGRNLDFIMNDSGVEGVEPYFKLGNGTEATEITMTRTSVPVAYLNAKVNIASANNLTNAMLANKYNEFNPYKRPFVREEGVDTSFIKDTMEFHNCVIFIQETNDDLSTHREFTDKNWHFYAIGNIGDSKKTDKTRLTDKNDPYEFCVEIMDVELPLSDFPVDTMYNAMGYKEDSTTHERTYIWAKDENLGILYELIDGEYVLTEDTTVDLNKTYYVDILEHDDFSEDYTYGWRYISNKKDPATVNYCKQKWIDFYRFVTTSTDEEFKAHLGDYFVVDSALYYFLFANRYCLADNLAKNSFWHYGKTGTVDSEGNPIRKWDLTWGYDMDKN